jgi:ribosomal protein S18 acetylase RimI-like enzyme
MDAKLRELEEMVVDAWPAAETADLDGWLLRASGGLTHRGNSVAPLAAGTTGLDARIARAEAWYRERGLRPAFQLGPCAVPSTLDDALADRGYLMEGAALLLLAPPDRVAAATAVDRQTTVERDASPSWAEVGVRASRFAGHEATLRGFLRRLASRCRFATALDASGRPVAAALGITSEARLGVYAMLTVPDARRSGAGRAVLGALARTALAEDHRELYLLVEADNTPARRLYASAGFEFEYSYHYRVATG